MEVHRITTNLKGLKRWSWEKNLDGFFSVKFQFKHCTIIRPLPFLSGEISLISIQALYDYKSENSIGELRCTYISIQALYDYKKKMCNIIKSILPFQFKHCTIIRKMYDTTGDGFFNFNSSIVRL